jgi:hypothetical protein
MVQKIKIGSKQLAKPFDRLLINFEIPFVINDQKEYEFKKKYMHIVDRLFDIAKRDEYAIKAIKNKYKIQYY